jgi:uncharacterized RDD family membrane protein YckC
LTDISARALAVSSERLRLLFARDKRLFEEQFDSSTGQSLEPPAELAAPSAPQDASQHQIVRLLMVFALVLLVLATTGGRRAPPVRLPGSDNMVVAPPLHRLMAASLDALPLILGFLHWAGNLDRDQPPALDLSTWPLWVGLAIYVLHTTLSEVLTGRTIGKRAWRLQVTRVDGSRPGVGALLIRNLIRPLEVPLIGALLVLYSPLRQRLGDLAAGTVVTARRMDDEEDPSTSSKDEQQD